MRLCFVRHCVFATIEIFEYPVAANKHNMVIDSPDRGLIVCVGLWVRDRDESERGRPSEWSGVGKATNENDERASIAA